MDYTIREMRPEEYPLLENFLYEAVFLREGEPAPPRSITKEPALQGYIADFGTGADDLCLCAETGGKIVGAVWVRRMAGYGSIGNGTPELAISLYREYRGQGIGTDLLRRMLSRLKETGCRQVSLSVQKENRAARMYRAAGFQTVRETAGELIMAYDFQNRESGPQGRTTNGKEE